MRAKKALLAKDSALMWLAHAHTPPFSSVFAPIFFILCLIMALFLRA